MRVAIATQIEQGKTLTMISLEKATVPTMYFIGVTTTKSSIMKVFPEWAVALGLNNTVMKGIDIPIHADPSVYRQVVEFIKNDELSMGALVTTHKIDLFNAASDLFEYLDPYATRFGELSSISKSNGKLCGHAKDPISSGLAMSQFVPKNYWKDHPEAGVMIMGAGGSSIAMCSYLMRSEFEGNYPSRIVIANRSQPRLDEIKRINADLTPGGIELEYHLTPEPGQNDAVMATMGTGSLIVCLADNLTTEVAEGIGKLYEEVSPDGIDGNCRVVFKDSGFNGSDEIKTNTLLILKQHGITNVASV